MLNNRDFLNLERRLWSEGNPLTDELTSTRDELLYLLSQAKLVIEKYSPAINKLSDHGDLDFYREWDDFGDVVEGIEYALGVDL